MAATTLISGANANANNFIKFSNPQAAFSIDAEINDILTGTPTWTLLVSNIGDVESNFKEYSTKTTNMLLSDCVESLDIIPFAFIGVKFNSNTSTGTYSFFLNTF